MGMVEIAVFVLGVLSFTTHEAAHAYVADWLGDPTPRKLRRRTLNPIPHLDPLLSLVVPGILYLGPGGGLLFGGARPTPITIYHLRGGAKGWAVVAVAGPLCNLLLAMLCALLVLALTGPGFYGADSPGTNVLLQVLFWNVFLVVFNLIPVPPLDGSRVFQYFLGPKLRDPYLRFQSLGFILVVVWMLPFGGFDWLVDHLVLPLVHGISDLVGIREIWDTADRPSYGIDRSSSP